MITIMRTESRCVKHPEAPAARACVICARPFCESCLVGFLGQPHCAVCRDVRVARMQSAKPPTAPDWLFWGFLTVTCPLLALLMASVAIWMPTGVFQRLFYLWMAFAFGALGWTGFRRLRRR